MSDNEARDEKFDFVRQVLHIACETDHQEELRWYLGADGTGPVQFFLDCSDTFHWASADSEEIRPDDLPLLRQCVSDLTEIYGSVLRVWALDTLYAARKRQMRPMQAWFKQFEKYRTNPEDAKVFALLMAAGPERTRESEG